MSGIVELIRIEESGNISFGNHLMDKKKKISDFEVGADIYKVKTFSEFTKLEKNGKLLFESNPGTTVYEMELSEDGILFYVEGDEEANVLVELEADTNYNIIIDGRITGTVKSSISGKVNFSVDFNEETKKVEVVKE